MRYKQNFRNILGVILICAVGTTAHFLYEWSGNNRIVGLFCPINESTWEHIKLLFFPMLFYTIGTTIGTRRQQPDWSTALLAGNLFGCACIPVIFYTYTGILGFHLLALDIGTFVISTILAFCFASRMMQHANGLRWRYGWIFATIAVTACFFIFTFYPPSLALFVSP